MSQNKLQDVIHRLVQAIEAHKKREDEADYELKANPPATPEQIAALEAHLGRKLSPLFREFLSMHNGYQGLAFYGDMLSVEEMLPGSDTQKKFEDFRKDMVEFDNEQLKDAVFFANNDSPSHWSCFYPGDGEWACALWLNADDVEYDDLIAYLESRIEMANYEGEEED